MKTVERKGNLEYTIYEGSPITIHIKLLACPICGERFGHSDKPPIHLETHSPEDFGL